MPKSVADWFNKSTWDSMLVSFTETIICITVGLATAALLSWLDYWPRLVWVICAVRICQILLNASKTSPKASHRESVSSQQ